MTDAAMQHMNSVIGHLTPHFRRAEFSCKCGRGNCAGAETAPYMPLFQEILEPARVRFDRPVYITSGVRCPSHNAAVGGSRQSRHLTGHAVDVCPAAGGQRTLLRLFAVLELEQPDGLGLYFTRSAMHGPRGHIHVDHGTRTEPVRWIQQPTTRYFLAKD